MTEGLASKADYDIADEQAGLGRGAVRLDLQDHQTAQLAPAHRYHDRLQTNPESRTRLAGSQEASDVIAGHGQTQAAAHHGIDADHATRDISQRSPRVAGHKA